MSAPDDDAERWFAEAWNAFVRRYRATRAPEALRERVRAAIATAGEEPAATGSDGASS